MSELDDQLDDWEYPTRDVPICLKPDLIRERDRAMSELDAATRRERESTQMVVDKTPVKEARARVEALEKLIRQKSITIRLTGVDRHTYASYLLLAPPRQGKREIYDPTKFFMVVARKTGKHVGKDGALHDISDEQWERIDAKIDDGTHDRIAEAVLEVNRTVGGSNIDFLGSASATTPDSSETSD
ncbi:MAG: hypothetical protein DBW62_00620 [Microbacterium sp.]|nr:MAG: hypothetical protein DBW62_00620 [Microbacterium sp.]